MDVPGQPVPDEQDTTPDFIISGEELDRVLSEVEKANPFAWVVTSEIRRRFGLPEVPYGA